MDNEFKLNLKQRKAYEDMKNGENILLTGPAGSGKSALIKYFYRTHQDTSGSIALTSTTGVSAVIIGGCTLHSYLGIGLGTNSIEKLVSKISNSNFYKNRWRKLKTLIIDEVSMLSPELFDKLELMARQLRDGSKPFGGIQLILSGDLLQLPVVKCSYFCFDAESWPKCIKKTVYLNEIIRQNDPVFQKCLSEVRIAKLSESSLEVLAKCQNNDLTNDLGIKPTRIYPINASVDKINTRELEKIGGEHYQYEMEVIIHSAKHVDNVARYKKGVKAEEILTLAEGAQVVLCYNLDVEAGLVNGSRGVVTKFIEDVPMVKFMNGGERLIDYHIFDIEEIDIVVASIIQIPLKLAYACTVHSSQGLSLDCLEISMKNIFEYGQAYVALSRARNLQGLKILDFDPRRIKAHPRALQFYRDLEEQEESLKLEELEISDRSSDSEKTDSDCNDKDSVSE